MVFKYQAEKNQAGMVLLLVLLILWIISAGLLSTFARTVLEMKMVNNDYDYWVTWEAAEKGLLLGEAEVRFHQHGFRVHFLHNVQRHQANIHYHVDQVNVDACGKKHYRVFSVAQYHGFEVRLVSEYEVQLASTPSKKFLCIQDVL